VLRAAGYRPEPAGRELLLTIPLALEGRGYLPGFAALLVLLGYGGYFP
jgi:hypothetical protein